MLIVEDENDLRELLHDYLSSRGYTVVSACNGEEGLKVSSECAFRPTLLVTDVVMPGMGGRALADALRQS